MPRVKPDAIAAVELRRLRLPLIKPYRLSLGTVTAYDTLLVVLVDGDGREGFGEATLLAGYTDETIDESLATACRTAASIAGTDMSEARAILRDLRGPAPFSASAFLSALDVLDGHPALRASARLPLLAILSTDGLDPGATEAEVARHITAGYRTLKFKVGFDVRRDLEALANVQRAVHGRALIRVDANQGYSVADAVRFLREMDPVGIELIEQPCDKDDWEAALRARRAARVPYMLDEQIYAERDIDRAAELQAADIIKLKLMKLGGIDDLRAGLDRIRARGMRPVCGNGVATDLGCWLEAAAAAGHIDSAGEMNGFLKTETRLLDPPLAMSGPDLVLDGRPRRLNLRAVVGVTSELRRFPAV